MYQIYTLTNPINGLIFYVGMTEGRLIARLYKHCYFYRNVLNPRTPLVEVILELAKNNRIPIIEEIDSDLDKKESLLKEKFWIYQLNGMGFPLTNKEVVKKQEYEIVYTDRFSNGICVVKGEIPPTEVVFFSKTRDREVFDKINGENCLSLKQ